MIKYNKRTMLYKIFVQIFNESIFSFVRNIIRVKYYKPKINSI